MMAVIRPHAEAHIDDIINKTNDEAVHRLGSSGVTVFYTKNYLAPQHKDNDASISISCQLGKAGVLDTEYDFAYLQWGISIETRVNSVWLVLSALAMSSTLLPSFQVIQL